VEAVPQADFVSQISGRSEMRSRQGDRLDFARCDVEISGLFNSFHGPRYRHPVKAWIASKIPASPSDSMFRKLTD
jgi:hypothetical protein